MSSLPETRVFAALSMTGRENLSFADAEEARARSRRERVRATEKAAAEVQGEWDAKDASVVRRRAESLIKLIDHQIERAHVAEPFFGTRFFSKAFRNLKNRFSSIGKASGQKSDDGDLLLMDGRAFEIEHVEGILKHGDLAFELAVRALESREAILKILLHGSSPSEVGAMEASDAAESRHRLSGDGK